MVPYAQRLRWYKRRLQAMPAGEMRSRVGRTARHRWDDLSWRLSANLWQGAWCPPTDFVTESAPAVPLGFLTADRGALLRDTAPEEAAGLVAAADAAIAGRIRFFGYPEVQLPTPVDYAYDPHADVRWPGRHGKQIDYRHIGRGDPKWIWELNRCQQLPLLIQAWLVTGDDSYARSAVRQTLQWGEQNPPGRGIPWANGYEAGVRAISLSVTYDALRGSDLLDAAQRRRVLEMLWQHGRWIQRDPSTHSSANNHRLGELVGSVAICALAPELRDAERWYSRVLPELAEQATAQILPDGMGAELAFAYHLYVVDLLLVSAAILDAVERPVPPEVLHALARSGDAIWAQVGEDEPSPTYGDRDDAVAIRLSSSEQRDARDVAAGIACRLDHPRARLAARWPDWTSWWMFEGSGQRRIESTRPAAPPESVYLPDGGLVLLRRGPARVTVDVGPLGFLSLAAHGHADALAVTVVRDGEELVTDPGVGSYFRDPEAREAFRGTTFHATVEVDDEPQSEPGGAFLWTRHAGVTVGRVDLEEAVVFAEHDGYQALPDPVRHQRAVKVLDSGEVLVCDLLGATGAHRYAQHWPLPPALAAQAAGDSGEPYHAAVAATAGQDLRMGLSLASSHPGRLRLARGERDPMRGWWSARLESMEPAWLCSWLVEGAGTVALAALIIPGAIPASPLRVAREGAAVLVTDGEADEERVHRVDFDRRLVEVVR